MAYRDRHYCMSCGNTSYVKVYEHEVASFRVDLIAAQERAAEMEWKVAAAIYRIRQSEEQAEAFLRITNRPDYDPFYLDEEREPTDEELREAEQWLNNPPSPSGNFVSGGQAEAGYGTLDLEGFTWQDERNSKPL